MKKQNSIHSQKVYVLLESVLTLQQKYLTLIDAYEAIPDKSSDIAIRLKQRIFAFEIIITDLQLPIDLQPVIRHTKMEKETK